ncbi:MAG: hypothetical protein J6Y87_04165 [Muribaculaceae bacterium]|nr:hypothetical protein [Muribaculaceae bacterium]
MKKISLLLGCVALTMMTWGCGGDEPDNPGEAKVASATADYYISVTPDVLRFLVIHIDYMADNNSTDFVHADMAGTQTELNLPTATSNIMPARFGLKAKLSMVENPTYDGEANYTLGYVVRGVIRGYDKDGNEVALSGPNEDSTGSVTKKGSEIKALLKQYVGGGYVFSRGWFVYPDGQLKPGLI